MKNFIIILSFFLTANLAVYAQEIIKTKSIEQIEVKSPTLRYLEAKSGIPGKDTIIRICSPSRAEMLSRPQPLYVIIYGNKQIKTLPNHEVMEFKPNWISKIDLLKDKKAINAYGVEGKNGVLVITIENKFIKDFKKILKKNGTI